MILEEKAKEILEEFANYYSEMDVLNLAERLNIIKNLGAIEVLDSLRGLLEGYVHEKDGVSLYEHYKRQYINQ